MTKDRLLQERLTKQLFFNMVIGKMRKQAKPGICDNVLGLRASDGSRCSLGWLITEANYKPEFETLCPNAVMIDLLKMPPLGWMFYDDLQEAHDTSAKSKDWWPSFVREMRKVAKKHFLAPDCLSVGSQALVGTAS